MIDVNLGPTLLVLVWPVHYQESSRNVKKTPMTQQGTNC